MNRMLRVWPAPIVLFVAIAGFFAAPWSVSSAPEAQWVTFTSKATKFSIDMPTQPTATTTTTSSFIGNVTNEIFTSWEGHEKFTIDHSQIPRFALHFAGADTIYDHAQGALLKQTWSKPISFTDVTVDGRKGKQLVYDTPPVPGKPETAGMANFFLIDDRLYVVDAVVPEGDSEANAQRFLASVRFQ